MAESDLFLTDLIELLYESPLKICTESGEIHIFLCVLPYNPKNSGVRDFSTKSLMSI